MTGSMNRATFSALLSIALLTACDDFKKNTVQEISGPVPAGGLVKFFNFGVSAPAVNFYANDRKVTAITSATGEESTSGVAYGAVGAGGFYTAIAAGPYTLTGRIAAMVDKDLAISTVGATIEDGKYYSFYQSGIYNATTKSVDGFVLEDLVPPELDYSVAYVRFVEAISNATHPMLLYAKGADSVEVQVSTAAPYKQAGAFTAIAPGAYKLFARYEDSTANKARRPDAIRTDAALFLAGRVYTVTALGNITVASGTNAPALDYTGNR